MGRAAPFVFLGPWLVGMVGITLGPMIAKGPISTLSPIVAAGSMIADT